MGRVRWALWKGRASVSAFQQLIQTSVFMPSRHLSSLFPLAHMCEFAHACVHAHSHLHVLPLDSHPCCTPGCVSSHLNTSSHSHHCFTLASVRICPLERLHTSYIMFLGSVTLVAAHRTLCFCLGSCVKDTLLKHFRHCSGAIIQKLMAFTFIISTLFSSLP